MRDLLLDFGLITLGTPGSDGAAGTPGYSENCTDFEVETEDLANLLPAVLVITADGAVSNVTITLYSGAADNPTTGIFTYPAITAMADGDRVELALPLSCARYLRVGGTGSGKVKAAIEMGGKSAA